MEALTRSIPLQEDPLEAPFAHLSSECRRALVYAGELRRYSAGEILMRAGEPASSLFLVLSGQAKMERPTLDGRSLILALLGPGELFGVASAIGGETCPVTVETLLPMRCLEVPRPALLGLLRRHPYLLEEVLPLLTRGMRECSNCLVEEVCSRVEVRFARLFLDLDGRLGLDEASDRFVPLPLSRQELADLTGTTLETAIRVMSRWNKKGLVMTRRDGFLVRDLRLLERIALEQDADR
jgi:CRP/FNR family transcriptional regulator, nitrogen oxide reductase regulator